MLSFIFALPDLGSMVAFNAVSSIAAIGLYFSFGADFQKYLFPSPTYPALLVN